MKALKNAAIFMVATITYFTTVTSGFAAGLQNGAVERCLDLNVTAATGSSSFDVITYTCHGGENQKWKKHEDGTIRIQHAGAEYCLDVDPRAEYMISWKGLNYSNVHGSACHGKANQIWKVIDGGKLQSAHKGLCLDMAGDPEYSGYQKTVLANQNCNGAANQTWHDRDL